MLNALEDFTADTVILRFDACHAEIQRHQTPWFLFSPCYALPFPIICRSYQIALKIRPTCCGPTLRLEKNFWEGQSAASPDTPIARGPGALEAEDRGDVEAVFKRLAEARSRMQVAQKTKNKRKKKQRKKQLQLQTSRTGPLLRRN